MLNVKKNVGNVKMLNLEKTGEKQEAEKNCLILKDFDC